MVDKKAMKRGMDLMTSLGWMCVFIAAFMLVGDGAADKNFLKAAIMIMSLGFFVLLPGTLVNLCIVIAGFGFKTKSTRR